MGLTVILRGFKAPIVVLDRFHSSNGVEETNGTPPRLFYLPGGMPHRARPPRQGHARSTYGYVAYAYTMVYSQHMIDLARELPDQAPPGFAELRREILGFAEEGDKALLRVARIQGAEGEDCTSLLFIVVTDEREFPLERNFIRQSDLRYDHYATVFDYWFDLLYHQRDVHGVELRHSLPVDL
ncbi:hypothetical protein P885DRAFT_72165 [Corynascus similis CBS 632.67]